MIVANLGPQYSGDVIRDRAQWTLEEWSAYMNAGTVPQDRLLPPPMTPQHYIFNMSCLEISTTIFLRRLGMPSLHRQLDPLSRFKGNLKVDKDNTTGLYFMSSKAGSFSPWHVDATGEVHWLTVMRGIKWVFILPLTQSVLRVWYKAEHGSIRADLLWLPDVCTDTPVVKQIVGPGQSILFPSGCLHAVYTETDSLALAGGWVDEYNLSNHLSFRKLELKTRTLKVNRFSQFERVCWLLGQEYAERWSEKKRTVPIRQFMQQIHGLIEFLMEEAK
ncbi:JmjC domain-containing histone demethylation protein 1 [Naganishia albida]|nr:JmjC domain-containing histone demethylation protein 1 [Naganishia albida]